MRARRLCECLNHMLYFPTNQQTPSNFLLVKKARRTVSARGKREEGREKRGRGSKGADGTRGGWEAIPSLYYHSVVSGCTFVNACFVSRRRTAIVLPCWYRHTLMYYWAGIGSVLLTSPDADAWEHGRVILGVSDQVGAFTSTAEIMENGVGGGAPYFNSILVYTLLLY